MIELVLPLAHPSPQPKRQIVDRFSRFCTDDQRVSYTLQWDALFPSLKIAPSHGRSGAPSNIWFPGPTWVLNPNGISISSAVFPGLTSVTDRLTDHATQSVTVGCIYVCSTAMRPSSYEPWYTYCKPHYGRPALAHILVPSVIKTVE